MGGRRGTERAPRRAAQDAYERATDPDNNVTLIEPGVIPDPGDVVYSPGLGAGTVRNVYYAPEPDTYYPDGSPGIIVVETDIGTVRYGARPR